MSYPLLLEINTRCWLRALSDARATSVTLATVPEEEIAAWQKHGFTHIWLMGVWTSGPKARAIARAQANLQILSAETFGTNGQEMLTASPYAAADFTVAEALGGEEALRQFRSRLHRQGLGLILDFVPNHLGVDHPWLTEKTSLFVQSATPRAETFPVAHNGRTAWVADGKDPYFSAWIDTAQLDYRLAATRAAMTDVLQSIASRCDGVRCDMAMLLLNDIIDNTWAHFPGGDSAPGEFWAEAIAAVKQRVPSFVFMAEAYWDLEPRLQALGFDYVYDKKFLDYLIQRDFSALHRHVRDVCGKFSPVRFLENHDEPRIASRLSVPEQKAAAMLLLAQPGMRLLHDGQMIGKERQTPVQFAAYVPEKGNPEMKAFYDQVLALLPKTGIGRGEMEFCETGLPHCFAMKWVHDDGGQTLTLVNLLPERASFQLRDVAAGRLTHIFSDGASQWDWQSKGLHIELAPCGFEMLEWAVAP